MRTAPSPEETALTELFLAHEHLAEDAVPERALAGARAASPPAGPGRASRWAAAAAAVVVVAGGVGWLATRQPAPSAVSAAYPSATDHLSPREAQAWEQLRAVLDRYHADPAAFPVVRQQHAPGPDPRLTPQLWPLMSVVTDNRRSRLMAFVACQSPACDDNRIVVVESADAVVLGDLSVASASSSARPAGTGNGGTSVLIPLREPLGKRVVIDAATGQQLAAPAEPLLF